jgi:cell division septum initiation protein DivIVA
MIKVLEQAIKKVEALSEERQREAAVMLEEIAAEGDEVYVLTGEERRLIQEARDEIDRGEIASAADVRATFDKYRICCSSPEP